MAEESQRRREPLRPTGRIDRRGASLFGELFACRIDGNRQMRVSRRRKPETLLQPALAHRRVEQVDPAHDMRDALQRIIDDHCKLVGVLAIGAQQDKIAHIPRQILPDLALDPVVKGKFLVRHAQPPGARCLSLGQSATAGAGIAQATVYRALVRCSGNLAARAGARIDRAFQLQAAQSAMVKIKTAALHEHLAVPDKTEPFQGAENPVSGTGHGARFVNVFDSQMPFAPL